MEDDYDIEDYNDIEDYISNDDYVYFRDFVVTRRSFQNLLNLNLEESDVMTIYQPLGMEIMNPLYNPPKFITKKEFNKLERKTSSKGENCPICLIQFEKDLLLVHLPCKHYYHEKCIEMWLTTSTTCPLCREVVDKFGEFSEINDPVNFDFDQIQSEIDEAVNNFLWQISVPLLRDLE